MNQKPGTRDVIRKMTVFQEARLRGICGCGSTFVADPSIKVGARQQIQRQFEEHECRNENNQIGKPKEP